MRRLAAAALVSAVLAAIPIGVDAQRGRGAFDRMRAGTLANVPYDGRFTVARIWYRAFPGWSYDYPDMERNLTTILHELTSIRPHREGSNVHALDDPELMKYPVAYLSEPGYWYPTDSEVEGLRTYLAKGAFLIVDDFHFPEEWAVFETAMRRVLPDARIERLGVKHPIFNTFFAIQSLRVPYPGRLGEMGLMGEFYGIHQDNDPTKRLSVVINYNMDIGDYMEWSSTGIYAIAPTNEAYKFGVNYIIYGLTR
jgi:hypothetical protein